MKTYPPTLELMIRLLLTGDVRDKFAVIDIATRTDIGAGKWARIAIKWANIVELKAK